MTTNLYQWKMLRFLLLLGLSLRCFTTQAGPAGQRHPPAKCTLCEIKDLLIKLDKKVIAIENRLNPSVTIGKSCGDLYKKGFRTDGVYRVDPDGHGSFLVRCDMTTAGGGWTVFQRRLDGSIDFYRGWKDYKHGFGDVKGEFWLGLDNINRLTKSSKTVLRVDLEDTSGNTRYAQYSSFSVSSERSKYQLSLGTYSGNAGDSLGYHKGKAFSTKDVDNDEYNGHCAVKFKGPWWHGACHNSNLNGKYHLGPYTSHADGVVWETWKGDNYSLKRTEMKIRPPGFPLSK